MVFLALSSRGVESYEALGGGIGHLWLSVGALSEAELVALRARHGSVTNLSYSISAGDSAVIEDAVSTIREHHPGELVWVEA